MQIEEIIRKIDLKLTELEALKPLSQANSRKLKDKYRLEWNYHSNHIEGNTLTYGQTQILLFKGRATGEHEKRDYDEMEAHDLAIDLVTDWSDDVSRDMTEADLRELNKILLVREFWTEAVTADGIPTRKKVIPGQYKKSPNSVRLKSGIIHNYPSPEETPSRMNDLIKWYNRNSNLHPLIRGAEAHHQFTMIHPFDDGNGRVARLWLNYILMKSGFPPIIIRFENKEEYLTSLEKADAGDIKPFIFYLGKELDWSLNLSLKAAKGEDIEESDDLEKEISILDKKIKKGYENRATLSRSTEVIIKLTIDSFYPLMEKVDSKLSKVKSWFNKSRVSLLLNGNAFTTTADIEKYFNNIHKEIYEFSIEVLLEGFISKGPDAFNISVYLNFKFHQWRYEVNIDNAGAPLIKKTYDETLTKEEIQLLTDSIIKLAVKKVKERY